MLASLLTMLNETATEAPEGFYASDGQTSVNAYSANCGVVYVYGPPGFQPKTWGQGSCFDPTMVSLPADYVEVFQ